MATADSVKAKIQSLIAKANTTTGKSDADLTKAVLSLVAGYGQSGGSCNLNHIIEVDTLPTENIVENALYKVGESYYQNVKEFVNVILVSDGVIDFNEYMQTNGATSEFHSVDNYENVTDPQPFDQTNMHIPLYYDVSRDDVFIYSGGAWMTFGDMNSTTNGGAITDISEATAEGYHYALIENGWKTYVSDTYDGEVVIS